MTAEDIFHRDLKVVKERIYDPCGFDLIDLKWNSDGADYGACSFMLNSRTIQYRASKITPKKSGQFVTVWKRNQDGITEPFNISDDFDFIMVASRSDDNFGQFVFPKAVLVNHGIVTGSDNDGKRGIRVYPPWDIPTSEQAKRTKNWQTKFFITLTEAKSDDPRVLKELFEKW